MPEIKARKFTDQVRKTMTEGGLKNKITAGTGRKAQIASVQKQKVRSVGVRIKMADYAKKAPKARTVRKATVNGRTAL